MLDDPADVPVPVPVPEVFPENLPYLRVQAAVLKALAAGTRDAADT